MRCSVFLFVTLVLGLVSALPYHGADFSSLLLHEWTTQIRYTASSDTWQPQSFEQILYDYGVNLARIRVWTSGTYNLDYGLELARRAKAAGMDLLIDLHYYDTWADAGHQGIPYGWPTDSWGLLSQVYNYTYGVVKAFEAQGTPIQLIQVANEVNNGPLWPMGQISLNGFTGASQLLHAGVLAVRDASPDTKTIIHLANGWNKADVSYFYSGIFSVDNTEKGLGGGLRPSDVDVMGFSFYPFLGTNATLSNLHDSMSYLVYEYAKDIMIVETDWPVTCNTTVTPLSEPSIPVDSEGQIKWIKDVCDVIYNISNDKALGIIYWEPGWIDNAALGSACADNLLVSGTGAARKSMELFLHM